MTLPCRRNIRPLNAPRMCHLCISSAAYLPGQVIRHNSPSSARSSRHAHMLLPPGPQAWRNCKCGRRAPARAVQLNEHVREAGWWPWVVWPGTECGASANFHHSQARRWQNPLTPCLAVLCHEVHGCRSNCHPTPPHKAHPQLAALCLFGAERRLLRPAAAARRRPGSSGASGRLEAGRSRLQR